MKIINKIMIGIAVICLLLCGGILVFAMNPDMTDALAQRMYGTGNNAETVTEGVTGSGNPENPDADGNIRVTLPNGTPGEMNGYVAPSMDELRIPEDVSSKNGFQPIQPEWNMHSPPLFLHFFFHCSVSKKGVQDVSLSFYQLFFFCFQ